MNMDEYQFRAARTINPDLSASETQMHALHEIASETGEIHGIFQKAYQGHEIYEDDLKSEIGDLLWGIAELCTARGYGMEEIAEINLKKISRRYPNGFDPEQSLHRESASGAGGFAAWENQTAGNPVGRRRTALWIEDNERYTIDGDEKPHFLERSRCSACGNVVYYTPKYAGRYCNNCGARMAAGRPEMEEINHAPLD